MTQQRAGWIVAAVVVVLAAAIAVFFVGCGGVGVRVTDPVKIDAVKISDPVPLSGPVQLDALKINQTVPIAIQGAVPIALPGPITLRIEGPSVEYQGTYVSESLMDRIQLGMTTAEWIMAVVGKPDMITRMSDGSEIWKWVYRPAGQMSLLSLPGQDKQSPTPQPITAYVRLANGVVVDKWRG